MTLELEALVTHIYIVGGRMVSAVPPGALATPAPKKVPRVREEESLFTLFVPAGELKAPADVYQSLAEKTADLYFKTTSSITAGLREVLLQINQDVLERQQSTGQPFQVSVICAVLRDQELYVARCGSMVAAFRSGLQFSIFPADRSPENLQRADPLGASAAPRLELNHYDVLPGALLILGDAGFAETAEENFKTALLKVNEIEQALEPVRALITSTFAHAMILQFITADTPTPITLEPSKPSSSRSAAPMVVVPAATTSTTASGRGLSKGVAKTLVNVADAISTTGDKIFPEEKAQSRRIPWLSNIVQILALLIPIILVIVVVSLALSQQGTTAFEVCRLDVLEIRDAARLISPPGQPLEPERETQARAAWLTVRDEALACQRKKPGDIEMGQTAGEAQNFIDLFDGVIRREVVAIRDFGAGADLRGPITGNWIQLYTLDRASDAVYEDILNPGDGRLVGIGEAPVIAKTQNIRGRIVGDLIDMTWMERGGLSGGQSNVPVVLDQSGLLVWYNTTFTQADLMQLPLPITWSNPVAIATWRLNFYVLDAGAQQIWRYVPNSGEYLDAPEEYFAGTERPDLENAIDMGIDEDGNVYVLFKDGRIRKYLGGEEQPFTLYEVPQEALGAASSLFVDNDPISRGLLVTDPNNEAVYVLTLGGSFIWGYRPLNDLDAFNDISGTLGNAEFGLLYILAGHRMYSIQR